jgi:hypothetical protein
MTWRMKYQPLCRKFFVESANQRLKRRAFEPQPKTRDAALEKFRITQ